MPAPIPKQRPDDTFTEDQWKHACEIAQKSRSTLWDTQTDEWRYGQCLRVALAKYPPPGTPAGSGFAAVKALKKGGRRTRKTKRRSRKTRRRTR